MTAVVHVYRYDKLGRRVLRVLNYIPQGTTDPADWVWSDIRQRWERGASDPTAISHGAGGEENRIVRNAYRDMETASNVTGQTETQAQQPDGTRVVRRLDRLGRALTIGWDDPASTPDVAFAHNLVGSRIRMEETGATGPVRTTHYAHDRLERLTQVAFDSDGDGTTDQTVRYEYDAGGLRTRLTLPGEVSIAYRYDAKGRLVGLTDGDGQASDFFYDAAGRHVATQRASGLLSDYRYNPAGHLRRIRHFAGTPDSLRARFDYVVDARGSRTQASERLAQPATVIATYGKDAPEVEYVSGTWTDAGAYKRSAQFDARIRIAWTGDEGLLTVGTGPDHSLIDVYIGGSLWQSYDCWAPTAGERVIPIPVDGLLEIHNRAVRNPHATGTVMRFKQLEVLEVPYDERTIRYTYDAVSRLIAADYDNGAEVLTYGFDVAGNLTNLNGTARTYNAANQLIHDGTNALTYDANGNMTGDGVNSYTWDRANRLLALGGVSYAYNGDGDRVAQTSGVNVTQYLLDLQPGLALVLGDSDGNRYVHAPRGIHAVNDGTAWTYPLADGLGSVRGYVDTNNVVLSSVNYTPVGVPDTAWMGWAFTGEWRSENETQYHRARHLSPGLATWLSLDPFEGLLDRPLSLNGYAYVHGNPVNLTDSSGLHPCDCIEVQYYTGRATLEEVEACLAGIRRPSESSCPRMPVTGKVYDWEKELLNLTAASEYRLAAAGIPESDVAKLGYALSWVVLNRITSPCWGGNFTRIHQAAFSGSAIRNRGVFGTAAFDETSISSLVVTLTNEQGQSVTFIDSESVVTGAQAREFTTHILENFLASSPGDQRTVEAMRPATNRALDEWCSGMNGPGVAVNAVFYATLSNSRGLYDNAINEVYDQLGMLERLGDGASCGGNFGWVGTSTDHSLIVACNNTLSVRVEPAEWGPTRREIRTRGQILAAERLIQYP